MKINIRKILMIVIAFHLFFLAFFFSAPLFGSAPSRSITPTPQQSPEQNKSKAFALKELLKELETNKVLLSKDLSDLEECNKMIADYHRRLNMPKDFTGIVRSAQVVPISPSNSQGSILRELWRSNRSTPSPVSNTCSEPTPRTSSPYSQLAKSVWINNSTSPLTCNEHIDEWLDEQ